MTIKTGEDPFYINADFRFTKILDTSSNNMAAIEIKHIADIEEKIHEEFVKFQKFYGKQPAAFLLGPHEYLSLQAAFMKKSPIPMPPQQNLPYYYGMQVFIKSTPGIEFSISEELVGLAFVNLEPSAQTKPGISYEELLAKYKGESK